MAGVLTAIRTNVTVGGKQRVKINSSVWGTSAIKQMCGVHLPLNKSEILALGAILHDGEAATQKDTAPTFRNPPTH